MKGTFAKTHCALRAGGSFRLDSATMRLLWSLSVLAMICLPAFAASAQSVSAAEIAYRDGNFAGALQSLNAALDNGALSTAELPRALELRAVIHHAQGNTEARDHDLRALLSLDPNHALAPTAPPSFRNEFRRLQSRGVERLAVESRAASEPDGAVRITTEVHRDAARVVEQVLTHVRRDDAFERHASNDVRVAGPLPVAWYIEAVGFGGVTLARDGTRADPRVLGPMTPERDPEEGGEDVASSPWFWVVLGAALAAIAAGIVVSVALVDLSEQTAFLPPRVLDM